ncbi:hypothetical protein WN71_023955 [Streptomyces mangrovisoli]|uniref:Uncharacterized protein n=1 Tax=Streptomyces mangrovisoli TaxID=1428628 RepID=A0A1J4NW91_9ACTN|nr:hypothetical protein WN71_023955 [Streptomyces mangrovisoli]
MVELERSAEMTRAKLAGLTGEAYELQWARWREAAATFHAAVAEYAGREDVSMSRYEVEQAAKRAVRHEEEDPAG